SAKEEYLSAVGTPTRVASAPQSALPSAIPPCNTSRYMDSARARSHDGDIVCAAMFKHASIPIQAIPAAKNTAHNPSKIFTCPAANVIPANSRMANATLPSIESLSFNLGSASLPANGPRPDLVSHKLYPVPDCVLP